MDSYERNYKIAREIQNLYTFMYKIMDLIVLEWRYFSGTFFKYR